ncbi:hypothetical protein QR98_0080310 [Sarcoptes scabiei]|uniref:Uncharacterized protein n=1 Tax=Sarcoptes scabiei TaxID=52283 RepID=A0A132AET6_SARSC|nr:hypothetical protein QR98_0080310 [Sarcoptes scabiei]
MKELTIVGVDAAVEGHQNKVDLEHKSSSSSLKSNQKLDLKQSATTSTNKSYSSHIASSSGSGSKIYLRQNSSVLSTPNNSNFDDDYNEWDISIGDLITDLDADIERQSEGDKLSAINQKNENNQKSSVDLSLSRNNNNLKDSIKESFPSNTGMSSSFRLNRLDSLANNSNSIKTNPATTSNNIPLSSSSSLNPSSPSSTIIGNSVGGTIAVEPVVDSSSALLSLKENVVEAGSNSNDGSRNHSLLNSQRLNNYTLSSLNVPTQTNPKNSLNSSSSLMEHHAKSLKMKIKRKNIGGRISETNHEIVSSDTSSSPQKTYISSIEQNRSNSNNSTSSKQGCGAALTSTTPPISSSQNQASSSSPHIATSNYDTSLAPTNSNSVINSNDLKEDNPALIQQSFNDNSFSSFSSKLMSKHSISAKNKNGHRDRKDKPRQSQNSTTNENNTNNNLNQGITLLNESNDLVSSSTASSTSILKYPNPTVMNASNNDTKTEDVANISTFKNLKVDKVVLIDDNISAKSDVGTMTSIATLTEPDCLGPCEPGTSVTLEGIVWQETENGVLVVNVTWRGKTYVGTLLDCTKHDWAPPRFCESPTSDIESKSLKNTRGKRARNSFMSENSIDTRSVTSKLRNGKGRRTTNSGYLPCSPAKNDPIVNSTNNKRKGRPNEGDLVTNDCNFGSNTSGDVGKHGKNKISKMDGFSDQQPNSPVLIECPEPNCSKKYRHINGLKYHQSHAHFGSTLNVSNETQEFETPTKNDSKNALKNNSNDDDVSDSENNEIANIQEVTASKNDENLTKTADCDEPNNMNSTIQLMKNNVASDNEGTHSENYKKSYFSKKHPLNHKEKDHCHQLDIHDGSPQNDLISGSVNDSDIDGNSDNPQQHHSLSDNKLPPNEIENVASPAYSDISDDNNSNNENPNISMSVIDTKTSENKKISNIQNFNVSSPLSSTSPTLTQTSQASSSLPNFFNNSNKSQFIVSTNNHSASSSSSKLNDLSKSFESGSELDNPADASLHRNQYSPYSLYRFGSSGPSSTAANVEEPSNNGKLESDLKSSSKDNVESNNNSMKQPIAELQSLKNRIQFPSYDYDMPKPKFPHENEREVKFKDKQKYSPQTKKLSSKSEKEDSLKEAKHQHEKGMKPTMETQGPPTLSNGYYYNPSFLSAPSFTPFDAMFRGNPINPMVMGPPYGPSNPFLHSQMRFPQMNPLDGLSIHNPPPSPSVTRPSTSSHSMSNNSTNNNNNSIKSNHSFNPPNILSPTSNISSSFKSSNNKESFPMNSHPPEHQSQHRSQPGMNPPSTPSNPMHVPQPPRHPLHTSAIGYPIFDPYSVHPFAPK